VDWIKLLASNQMTGNVQGGSNMTGRNCDLFTHNQSRSYLNHLVRKPNTQALSQITVAVEKLQALHLALCVCVSVTVRAYVRVWVPGSVGV
jgi:hypothetical protein